MPGNMNNLMKQAQKMQRQMEEASKEIEEKEITAAAGGGGILPQLRRDGQHHSTGTEMERPELSDVWYG